MHNFNDYVRKRIPGVIEKSIKLNELLSPEFDTIVTKSSIIVDFYNMQFNKDAELVVPIGTKDSPAGLTRINDSYVVITHTDNRPIFYVHSEEFKDYIKRNFERLEKRHSDEYKMAVVLKYGNLADNAESKQPIFFTIGN
jgi:hypothetical protein